MLLLVFSFLLGSISGAFVSGKIWNIERAKKIGGELAEESHLTQMRKRAGFFTYIFDFFKGLFPVLVAFLYFPENNPLLAGVALMAVMGHCYSIYFWFRGGKGVVTTAGAFLPLMPVAISVGAAVWITSFYFFRRSSIAGLVSIIATLSCAILVGYSSTLILTILLVSWMVIRKHEGSILELLSKKAEEPTAQ